jgi:hypothetical protein
VNFGGRGKKKELKAIKGETQSISVEYRFLDPGAQLFTG